VKGSIFPHLRACQQLIQWLLNESQQDRAMDNRSLLGFALEVYAYLVLANIITPYNTVGDRTLPVDHLLTSLGTLSVYDTFGLMFAGAHGLFETIPQISILYKERLEEKSNCSMESKAIYTKLYTSIANWELCKISSVSADLAIQREAIAEVYRYSLFIYLETAMSGLIVDDPGILCKIQDHIDTVFSILPQLFGSQYGAILLWPLMICGSCMVKENQREYLTKSLRTSRYQMKHCVTACDLLELLWRDTDTCAYGPYGLHLMMQKHNISYCMA
jgi:hypothetical protein